MTDKVYVIVEVGFDYDDNYYRSNGQGGHPIHVFFDKDLAEKVCLDKNVAELIHLIETDELSGYMEDGVQENEVEAYTEAGFVVEEQKNNRWTNYYISGSPENLDKEQAQKLFDKINLQWYIVREVDATVNDLYRRYINNSG